MIDYPNKRRIKIWGTARSVEENDELLSKLNDPDYGGKPEHAIVFTVSAWDVNCPQHIKPRYTVEHLADMNITMPE